MKINTLEDRLERSLLDTASGGSWQSLGLFKRSGVAVPLFSVYSKRSLGIGDFEDLRLLVDWAKITGNCIIQLLPMNMLGVNFCPYDSLSSFALEPAYLSVEKVPGADDGPVKEKIAQAKKDFAIKGNSLDYRIKNVKMKLLWHIFNNETSSGSVELKEFLETNAYWINNFALFMALKDYHNGLPWYEWEDRYKNCRQHELREFSRHYQKEIMFQVWVQWLAFRQLREAKEYAAAKNVLIKGDLPVLVSRDSTDVWAHPDFFQLALASGAPPDMYCAKGQRWGMPVYNWKNISADGYRYIKERIRYAQNFYDILRIDHVVGLFRIWSIPYNEPWENHGLNGFFEPPNEFRWENQGRQILTVMASNTKMLLCAEDLGVIPDFCPKVLADLGIPGCDVQRWVKDWKVKHDFLKPEDYRAISVAVLSTHDTTNWAAWWEDEAGTIDQEFFRRKCREYRIDYNYLQDKLFDLSLSRHGRLRWLDSIASVDTLCCILGREKEEIAGFIEVYENTYREKEKLWMQLEIDGPMQEKANPAIIRQALRIVLGSRAIFAIQSIFDWLSLDEIFEGDPYQYRINTPGTISNNNWTLRLPLALEDLLKHKVSLSIRSVITASGRLGE